MAELADWLAQLGRALTGDADMEVPCGDCVACCASSQFVLIEPGDTAARAAIPAEVLVPAPGLAGHLLMGHDERGRCPMLVDGACSIYEARPRTCRTYDCRVFTASAVRPEDQPDIAAAAARFELTGEPELRQRIVDSVDPGVVRPLERALRAVAPVAVELARTS